ncbi:MAG TPA: serine hydrolase domain-containing protein, partial [Gemmatimonadaceae bacterium]|nr:serine hydrolase domain-containing protein [Gemmatimonadaceae bacterium]
PGASVVVGRRGYAVVQKGFGKLGWTSSSARVSADRTIYDLASLTKVVGTTTAAMILFDQGKLDLDAPVHTYLPAFSGGAKDSVTVRQLLTHRSGLPAGRDLWRVARTPEEARAAVLATDLACRPGQCFIYSDLGADVLGFVIEAIAGESLDHFLHDRVFEPLGMNDTFFEPADSVTYRVAPTEIAPPRGYPIRGEVHDENAYTLGGVAGHAGLFSTAADLSIFAQMMLNGGEYNGVRIVSDSVVALFTKRTAGTRALGWDTADGDGGAGKFLDSRAYGHTGFTGTSIWLDPEREMFVLLLTNRVHAARARRPAKVISDVRADLADAAAAAVIDNPENIISMPKTFRADKAVGWNRPVRVSRSRSSRSRTSARRPVASKSTAKKTTSKASTAKKPTAKSSKSASTRKASTSKSSTAKSSKAKSSTAKSSTAKSSTAKSSSAKKSTAKKSTASSSKRGTTKKSTTAARPPAKKVVAKSGN